MTLRISQLFPPSQKDFSAWPLQIYAANYHLNNSETKLSFHCSVQTPTTFYIKCGDGISYDFLIGFFTLPDDFLNSQHYLENCLADLLEIVPSNAKAHLALPHEDAPNRLHN